MEAAIAASRSMRPVDDGSGICLAPPITLDGEASETQVSRPPQASDITAAKTGLRFNSDTSYEIWKAVGAKLAARTSSACWWLGDWLLFGERNYLRYRDAIDATGLDYQTLRNYAAVARRFSLYRRRDNLSFQHHAAVASLADGEQERWLDLAASKHWSLHTLRSQIRDAHALESRASHRVVRFRIDATREERWRTTASEKGVSLQQWIVETLDAATGNAS